MTSREQFFSKLATELATRLPQQTTLVAIDGFDGAGKTTFADDLSSLVEPLRPVIRASVDGFHNPKAIRYRQGRSSPKGFFEDSYNYDAFKRLLLDPLKHGSAQRYRRAFFNLAADNLAPVVDFHSPANAVVLIDGIFLHRPELIDFWDFSIFLRTDFSVSVGRCAVRDGSSPDPKDALNRRYVEGQRLYVHNCSPETKASIVVDYNDLSAPTIVRTNMPLRR